MFDERLKSLRKKCGYTQVSLAETLGVSKGTVAMWETGNRAPGYEVINQLSDMFDRRIDYILGYSNDDASPKLSEEEIDQLGQWEIEIINRDAISDYLRLDAYGKALVNSIIQAEKKRCQEQGTLLSEEKTDK